MSDSEVTSPPRTETRENSSPEGGSTAAAPGRRRQRYSQISDRGRCRFCRDKVERVDYKDIQVLQSLTRGQGRMLSRQRSGNCAKHQHMVKRAIKRARFIGFMGYTEGPPRGAKGGRSW